MELIKSALNVGFSNSSKEITSSVKSIEYRGNGSTEIRLDGNLNLYHGECDHSTLINAFAIENANAITMIGFNDFNITCTECANALFLWIFKGGNTLEMVHSPRLNIQCVDCNRLFYKLGKTGKGLIEMVHSPEINITCRYCFEGLLKQDGRIRKVHTPSISSSKPTIRTRTIYLGREQK